MSHLMSSRDSTREMLDDYGRGCIPDGTVTEAIVPNTDSYINQDDLVSLDDAAPPYERVQRTSRYIHAESHAGASLTQEGRVDIQVDTDSQNLAKWLEPVLRSQADHQRDSLCSSSSCGPDQPKGHCPALNVVIQLVGSRGDIQPFLAIGLQLQALGHRVRIATHPAFQSFVEDRGLEFFSIGGDPKELMAYMVRNAGLLPSFDTVMQGDVQKKRKTIREIMEGCWRSCIESGDGIQANQQQPRYAKPFVASAIIANPPAFAHIHCAEKLGVPLHLMFTMPWSPTRAFAHPLANIKASSADTSLTNYASHVLVEMMTWQGVGNIVNSFRCKTLGLDRIDSTFAPGMMTKLKIPHTYCWSPSLMPKPADWGQHIDVTGFSLLESGVRYTPPPALASFIRSGSPPVYIGFGSIVVDDPEALTATIFEAVRLANVRAIVSHGWGKIGETMGSSPDIFLIGECPHDWLFKHVSCVVHHGGAGTTAAGLTAGKPMVVVPFFGDQRFWGDTVTRARAGPPPILHRLLSAAVLADAIMAALDHSMRKSAASWAARINNERGAEAAAKSFCERLPLRSMACSVHSERAAVWWYGRKDLRLSSLAATVLTKQGLLNSSHLTVSVYRSCNYELGHGPWEPVSGGALAVSGLFYNVFKGVGEIGTDLIRLSQSLESAGGQDDQAAFSHLVSSAKSAANAQSGYHEKALGSNSVRGAARICKATIRSPMTFTLAMAQGAHNAPRLWHDTTVRRQEKITGLGSGLAAAGKELFLGTYDGIAGLIRLPYIGARDGGIVGAVKGAGKGLAGTPTKFFAAMSGTVGYTLKGLDMEISGALKGSKNDAATLARIAQGEQEYLEVDEKTKAEIVRQWHLLTK